MQMNRVEVAGHLAKKPEVRYLPASGLPVANVRLGQTYRFQDNSQQWYERTNWHSLSFYGDLSKVALSFDKGENIFVERAPSSSASLLRRTGPSVSLARSSCGTATSLLQRAELCFSAAARSARSRMPQNTESIPDPEGAPLSHDEDWPVR